MARGKKKSKVFSSLTGGTKKGSSKKKAPIPTTGKLRTGGAVGAAAPLPFNNALPAKGAKSEPTKTKKKSGRKENAGRRKARR